MKILLHLLLNDTYQKANPRDGFILASAANSQIMTR